MLIARYFIYGFWLNLPDHVWLSGVKFPALLAIPTLQKCGHNPTALRYRDSTWSSYENTSVWDVCETIFDMFSLHVDTFEIFEYVYREIDGKLILYLSKENRTLLSYNSYSQMLVLISILEWNLLLDVAKIIHTTIYKHTVYSHAYHLNVPTFVYSEWSKIWFRRPIWDRCLHDGRASFLRGRSIQGALGFFWLYCTHQCGPTKYFGQDARNRQSGLMISRNKLILSNMILYFVTICQYQDSRQTVERTAGWILPLCATSVSKTWNTCEGWLLTCWTCLDERMWSRLLGMSGNMEFYISLLEVLGLSGIIKVFRPATTSSSKMILLARSSGKKSQEVWWLKTLYLVTSMYDKKEDLYRQNHLVIKFQYIRELNYLIVELRWVYPSSDMLRVLRKRECIICISLIFFHQTYPNGFHLFYNNHIFMHPRYGFQMGFLCTPSLKELLWHWSSPLWKRMASRAGHFRCSHLADFWCIKADQRLVAIFFNGLSPGETDERFKDANLFFPKHLRAEAVKQQI